MLWPPEQQNDVSDVTEKKKKRNKFRNAFSRHDSKPTWAWLLSEDWGSPRGQAEFEITSEKRPLSADWGRRL